VRKEQPLKQPLKKEAELLIQWREELNASELPLIVECREDQKSLRNIGITNEILILNTGPRYKFIEHVVKKHKRVIILTDFDKEGKKLYGILTRELSTFGVFIDKKFREILQTTKLDQIEGIERYYARVCGEFI
jgi:5S rRNA maturation endonuclease (ribonuclease M5)